MEGGEIRSPKPGSRACCWLTAGKAEQVGLVLSQWQLEPSCVKPHPRGEIIASSQGWNFLPCPSEIYKNMLLGRALCPLVTITDTPCLLCSGSPWLHASCWSLHSFLKNIVLEKMECRLPHPWPPLKPRQQPGCSSVWTPWCVLSFSF